MRQYLHKNSGNDYKEEQAVIRCMQTSYIQDNEIKKMFTYVVTPNCYMN